MAVTYEDHERKRNIAFEKSKSRIFENSFKALNLRGVESASQSLAITWNNTLEKYDSKRKGHAFMDVKYFNCMGYGHFKGEMF